MAKVDLYPTKNSSPSEADIQTGTDFPGNKRAADVNLLGGSITSAPNPPPNAFLVKTQLLTDVATKLPAVPATSRIGLMIVNYDAADTIFVGPTSAVTADLVVGSTSGMQIRALESQNIQLSDSADVWAIMEAGKTAMVQIVEWIRV